MGAVSDPVQGFQHVRRHSAAANKAPIVITLVHGTFAPGAAWTKDGSTLRRQIADALGSQDQVVHFDVFKWSGRNTHKARIKAGHELANHIRKLRKSCPHCNHFIVAHSHGGNIALFAHKHLPEKLHALGIATLGTPFLYAKLKDDLEKMTLQSLQQEVMDERDILSGVLAFTLAVLSFLTIQWSFNVGGGDLLGWLVVGTATLLTFGITYPLFKFVLLPRLAPTLHWYSGRLMALRLAKAIEFPGVPRTHVLSFAYPRDEAGLWLDGLELLTKVPTWLMKAIVGIGVIGMVPVFAVHYYADKAQALAGVFQEFLGPKLVSNIAHFADVASNALVMLGLTFGALWLFMAGIRSMLGLFRGHPWGFGWESPLLHNWAEIGANTKPELPQAGSNFTEVVRLAKSGQFKGKRHNHFYEDGRILKALSYWMAKISAPKPAFETEQQKGS